ncbi:acyl carrier protein [Streptomyces sp. RerS4]|uniref:acyl carrier protein n=1 Tax=Streptomyces sp. RerS4 TaxID=2942449 RepID=UPI00201C34A0|nr:acyl carrier protein [Streptomyces sp. RerS4]UQX03993.1 acyl carrier protein [Streptomyces sp. RerS4]
MTTSTHGSVLDTISALILENFEVSAEEVHADAPLRDLLADSLMLVEMAIMVHEAIGAEVTEDELRTLTLGELAAAVSARRTEA